MVAGAFTLGTTVHVEPFHCSMRVPPPAPEFSEPTATQKVEVVQDTSASRFEPDPAAALMFVQLVAATVGGLVMERPRRAARLPGPRQERRQRAGCGKKEHPECRHDRPLIFSARRSA